MSFQELRSGAAELNNVGVRLMNHLADEGAGRALESSLEMLIGAIRGQKHDLGSSILDRVTDARELLVTHGQPNTDDPTIAVTEPKPLRSPSLKIDSMFVYNKPMYIENLDFMEGHHDAHCCVESTIVLFNLALLYHEKNSKRAITFYNMAFTVMKDLEWFITRTKQGALLHLAILNNMGEIYYRSGKHERAFEFFSHVSLIVMSFLAHHGDGDSWSAFLHNTLILQGESAPAA
mmetsp:Transcript_27335/g.42006  ORF Transcript_27335/g.42006 Transcript_27335/m.42006 type:complete len:234 (+) Transcript_27335:57-758(+)